MPTHRARVEALERASPSGRAGLVIFIRGLAGPGHPQREAIGAALLGPATAGVPPRFERQPAETAADFEARVAAEVRAGCSGVAIVALAYD